MESVSAKVVDGVLSAFWVWMVKTEMAEERTLDGVWSVERSSLSCPVSALDVYGVLLAS